MTASSSDYAPKGAKLQKLALAINISLLTELSNALVVIL